MSLPKKTRPRQFNLFRLRSVLVFIACLLCVELSLRQERIRNLLPTTTAYYSTFVDTKLNRLTAFTEQNQSPDVLFIGSSAVFLGIKPLMFDEIVNREAHIPITSFNGGLAGLQTGPTAVYLEHFWLDQTTPALIVQGIRYTEVVRTIPVAEMTFFTSGIYETQWINQTLQSRLMLWFLESNETILANYTSALAKLIALPTGPRREPARDFPTDERGYSGGVVGTPLLSELLEQQPLESILTEEHRLIAQPSEVKDISLGLGYLEQSIQLAQSQGIDYIIVNIPDYPPKFDATDIGRENYTQYLEQVKLVAERYGVPFVDVMESNWEVYSNPEFYIDVVHLSPAGAERFTHDLAVELAPYLSGD